jgi:hypothetical protein
MNNKLQINFQAILNEFKNHIADVYQTHENTFDLESFHGRFHILRSLFLANSIMEFYNANGIHIDSQKVFYAVMFHDIARQDNGFDYWEKHSALICFDYMVKKGFSRLYAYQTSHLILKKQPFTIEVQILYDVDVLDYYRFFTLPQQQIQFKESKLMVGTINDVSGLVDTNFRKELMAFTLEFALFSEKISVAKPTEELIDVFFAFYIITFRYNITFL